MTERKVFIPLENNPEVMTGLAYKLGLSDKVQFWDLFSLTDPDAFAYIPRPALALLFVYPETDALEQNYRDEFAREPEYNGTGDQPVMFFKQTITHACGLIGLLHCTVNGARSYVRQDSDLETLMKQALDLKPDERAQFLHDSDTLEAAHEHAAQQGDTAPPERGDCPPEAFIAFVKGSDGHLYELEGRRKGPVDRGILSEGADVLSNEALAAGPLRFIEREKKAGGNVMFSCTVLA